MTNATIRSSDPIQFCALWMYIETHSNLLHCKASSSTLRAQISSSIQQQQNFKFTPISLSSFQKGVQSTAPLLNSVNPCLVGQDWRLSAWKFLAALSGLFPLLCFSHGKRFPFIQITFRKEIPLHCLRSAARGAKERPQFYSYSIFYAPFGFLIEYFMSM